MPTDDQRAECVCGREIRFCGLKKKWFHVHNFMTFCTGMAIDDKHVDQPRAEPVHSQAAIAA
jgi:hypothetical protein